MIAVLLMLLFIPLLLDGLIWVAVQESKPRSSMPPVPHSKASVIKTIYFYLVSLIALFMIVFSVVDLLNLGLKTWVFPKADEQEYKNAPCALRYPYDPNMTPDQRDLSVKQCEASEVSEDEARAIRNQRDAVRDLSMLVVALPLFAYHWRIVRREKENEK